jgi:hypothetical protein
MTHNFSNDDIARMERLIRRTEGFGAAARQAENVIDKWMREMGYPRGAALFDHTISLRRQGSLKVRRREEFIYPEPTDFKKWLSSISD